MAPASKTLLVFCDGSGEDGNLTNWNGWPNFAAPQNATNVLRLSRAVRQYTSGTDCRQQLVLYMSGVGSEADFEGSLVGSMQLLTGTAVASKIRDAYAFLAQNFNEGDEICLFGFSRGAYTVRKLAGLIDRIGLLTRENLGNLFTIWRQLVRHQTPTVPPDTRKTRIKCVGVWDTVGAILNTVDALGIEDTSLPPTVDVALHALSLQDNRDKFLPTLWQTPPDGLPANQILKQVWFPGAHSDVGGGYTRQDLSDLALLWMVGEIKSFIEVDTDLIAKSMHPKADPWGAAQPHNAYHLLNPKAKRVVRPMARLHGPHWQIIRDGVFHESLKASPIQLDHPEDMITLKSLQDHFGEPWEPSYAPLNEFERHWKDKWVSHTPSKDPLVDEASLTVPFKTLSNLLASWTSQAVISGIIALRSYDGKYMKVSTDEGCLAFHDQHVDDNAKFALINLDNGKISLKGPNGRLLNMSHSNHVMCIGTERGAEFEVVHLGASCIALTMTYHEGGSKPKFLSSGIGKEPCSSSLVVTDDMEGPSCCFVVEILEY
ncbi:hypothetical protein EDC04DRAFT_2754534 [Pisolithus marmoratus]|nr:hypothetical protein EDC04DRAFT_2754534 [Pisolithus marmoratus]